MNVWCDYYRAENNGSSELWYRKRTNWIYGRGWGRKVTVSEKGDLEKKTE